MRRIAILVALLCIIGGCQPPAEQGYYERITEAVNASVDAQQNSTREIVKAIDASRALPAAKLSEIEEKLDSVDAYVDAAQVAAAEAARVYEEKRAEGQAVAIIEGVRAANIASTPLNPYAPLIDAVLGAAAGIATAYGLKKRSDLSTVASEKSIVDKKYEAHKRGVETVMRRSNEGTADDLYRIIGDERKKLGIK